MNASTLATIFFWVHLSFIVYFIWTHDLKALGLWLTCTILVILMMEAKQIADS
jgi:hypothetical protein